MAHIIKNIIGIKNSENIDKVLPSSINTDNGTDSGVDEIVDVVKSVKEEKSLAEYQILVNELEINNENFLNKNIQLEHEVNELRNKLDELQVGFEKNKQHGYEIGREQGLESGLEDANLLVKSNFTKLEEVIETVEDELRNVMLANKDHIKDVILTALLKLISNVPSESIVISELDKLINNMSIVNAIKIHMSKKDYDILNNSEYSKLLPSCVDFVLDEKVLPGGMILQSRSESVDARLERKLELFKSQLVSA